MTVTSRTEKRGVYDDDDVYYYNCWRLKLEGETENMGVCTKERKGVVAEVLMATPCRNFGATRTSRKNNETEKRRRHPFEANTKT